MTAMTQGEGSAVDKTELPQHKIKGLQLTLVIPMVYSKRPAVNTQMIAMAQGKGSAVNTGDSHGTR
jgi:hypothetical protein